MFVFGEFKICFLDEWYWGLNIIFLFEFMVGIELVFFGVGIDILLGYLFFL